LTDTSYSNETGSGDATAANAPVDSLLRSARRMQTEFEPADGPGHLVWHAWGQGPVVVLLHGGAGSWRHWVHTIPALSNRYTVLAPDLPGLGESTMPPMPFEPKRVAGIVAAGLRQLLPANSTCALVGFSFGAMVAGHLAAAFPDLVHRLILVGAGSLGVPRAPIDLETVRDKQGETRQAANRTNLSRLMIADPRRIDELALAIQDWNVTRARVTSVGFAGASLLLDALRQVSCPIGAIWGERDHVAVPLLDRRIAALHSVRPDAVAQVIPKAGHWVAYEAPDLFNAALTRLLSDGL
jgi:pimeloyl-ACP methyl ester carboxylesterase